MALLKCIECQGAVSSRAAACPHCGCPVEETLRAATAKPLPSSLASVLPNLPPPVPPAGSAPAPAGSIPAPPLEQEPPPAAAAVATAVEAPPRPALPLAVLTQGGMTTLSLDRLVTVGRTKANILVEHQDVAPTHCRVEPGESSWRVVDVGDKGIFEAGERVPAATLGRGEVVDLGGFPGAIALALPSLLDEPLPLKLRVPGSAEIALVLLKLPMMIGRASWVDLPLADRNVSNVHARLRMEKGRIVLDDLQSRNGTFVGAARIKTGHALRRGDRIRFGETEVVFGEPVVEERAEIKAIEIAGAAEQSIVVDPALDPGKTPREYPDVVIPSGLSIEQLSAAPDQHVHVPAARHDATQLIPAPEDSCPSCGESFRLQASGVITGAIHLARTAVRIAGKNRPGAQVGRCSSCGARLAMCPECGAANTAPSLFEPIGCVKCGEPFVAG